MLKPLGALIDCGSVSDEELKEIYSLIQGYFRLTVGLGSDENVVVYSQTLFLSLIADDWGSFMRLKDHIPFKKDMLEKLFRYGGAGPN